MSEFVAGLSGRHAAAAAALTAAFGDAAPGGFEAADLKARASGRGKPKSFAPAEEGGPRHFAPLDRSHNPTEGWDPFDPEASTPENAGFVDPIAAAHEAGRAEGYAAALAEAAADAGRDRAFGETLGAALACAERFDRERVAHQLRDTVLALVTRLVGETGVSGELLAGRIAAAIDLLADSAESALLRVNPEDVALLDGRLPGTIFPIGDAGIARGSFVLESASTIVEDGPEQWLEQLTNAIERVAVPR
jgi:flagellar assembly protein FliH